MTWHFRPFWISDRDGLRKADLTNEQDSKAIREYIHHQKQKLERRMIKAKRKTNGSRPARNARRKRPNEGVAVAGLEDWRDREAA